MKLSVSLAYALTVLTVLAPPARAKGDNALRAAQTAYRDLRFESALKHLDRALERPNKRADLVNILELRGLTLAVLDRWKEARLPFQKLLTLDPKHILPEYVSPRFRTFFAGIRKRAQAAGRLAASDVTVTHTEPGDPLFVALRLENDPAGLVTQVRVRYRLLGTKAWKELQMPAGPMTRVRLRLESAPNGVRVHLDFAR